MSDPRHPRRYIPPATATRPKPARTRREKTPPPEPAPVPEDEVQNTESNTPHDENTTTSD